MHKFKRIAVVFYVIILIMGCSFSADARGSGAHFSSPKAGYRTGTYAMPKSATPKAATPKTVTPKSATPKKQ